MKTNLSEKIKALFENPEFVAKLENAEGPDAMYDLFKENGVELTEEEFEEYVATPLGEKNEEIDVADLDDVSGGSLLSLSRKALKYTWKASVKVWGGEKKAVKGITAFWGDVFSGKDPRKRM